VTRARLAAAVVAAGALALPVQSASACDPNSFPYCTTYCKAVVSRYNLIRQASDLPLPGVPSTGVAGCP
jgi:hypothetical protein